MRVFVIGATGHTGTQILDLALSRGHEPTAFVRSPHKIRRQDQRLKVLAGDPRDLAHRWIKKGRSILRDDAIRNADFRCSLIRHLVFCFAKKLSIECADK
jgi:putative NADH-flavin reductase